ncbi:MAG: fatty acid desaturase [Flavobacteriales bacterium]
METLIHPAKGSLSFSFKKSIWFYLMVSPSFFIDFSLLKSVDYFLFSGITFLTVSLGHSIGLHRGVIHKAYKTSPLFRNILVYLFVLTGLGSPITWMKLHYYRDYWQNKQDCPDYFAYNHSLIKDFWWYLHLQFISSNSYIYNIPKEDLENKWFNWLHNTWYLHTIFFMSIFYIFFGLNTVLFLFCFRISLIIIGHWYIGYACHKYGYERFKIHKAKESGYNDFILGLFSFGEGFHNNHHGHPTSARFSIAWYEIDLSWYCILLLEKLGLIYEVKNPKTKTTLKKTSKKNKRLIWKWPRII